MCSRLIVLGAMVLPMLLAGPVAGQGVVQNTNVPDSMLRKWFPQWQDSSVRALLKRFPTEPAAVTGVLRQAAKPQPSARLDELADSLVARALRSARQGKAGEATATSVVYALSGSAWLGEGKDIPYAGGRDRLIRLYRELPATSPVRQSVVFAIADLGPSERINDFLYQEAVSKDPMARSALSGLLHYVTPNTDQWRQGTPALREPLEARLVALARAVRNGVVSLHDPLARENLLMHAATYKWDLGGRP